MRGSKSLSFVVAIWSAFAIAVSMGIYAAFQYSNSPDADAGRLFQEHLWHALALGAIIYLLLWVVLRRVLLLPLRRLYLHLYGVGGGKLEPLELSTNVAELQVIARGVNVMIHRIQAQPTAEDLERRFKSLRDAAREAYALAPEQAQNLLDQVAGLQELFLAAVLAGREAPHPMHGRPQNP